MTSRQQQRTQTYLFLGLPIIGLLLITSAANADDAVPANGTPRYWKGNIHTHSLWSDGNDFPEMISEWYRTRDYNFLALTDHNVLSEGERWMRNDLIERRGKGDAVKKYLQRFGKNWVERRKNAKGQEEIRLKPLDEFRSLVEERGKFILIQAEEISDRSLGKPVHLNATNLKEVIPPVGGATPREAIANNLRAVQEQAKKTGRSILLHVNHPNFGFALTAEDLAAVTAERFFEVYNGHPGVNQVGGASSPSIDRMWDIANTIRIGQLSAPPLFGVGTDDSHNYHDSKGSTPGRGWVMVRSAFLTPNHIVQAMQRGDFYASSGVTLDEVTFDGKKLQLKIKEESGVKYTTQFIGTLEGYDATSKPRLDAKGKEIKQSTRIYSTDVGKLLKTVAGPLASYELTGKELYVRALVISSKLHPNPSIPKQREQAWTQPVGWTKRVK